ncbi:tetratricopeptide repeat protein [Deltaproteobacteria bacterium]|nr:tetratricopeptide repeat protein [Deltaproteobacteria bacterium]
MDSWIPAFAVMTTCGKPQGIKPIKMKKGHVGHIGPFKGNGRVLPVNSLSMIFLISFVLCFSACANNIDLKTLFTGEPVQNSSLTDDFFFREVRQFRPISLPVIDPVQITFESDPILYADVSPDGLWLVYTSGDPDSSELWLRSADPDRVVLPRLLTSEAGTHTAPVFSPDGRYIAFVGTAYDVKGDIYLMDVEGKDAEPRRLTGRDTEDGAPCFSPDGRRLYFHQTRPGEDRRYLVSMDLGATDLSPVKRDTGGDASFPAVSPDNGHIAFISYRDDPNGDIFLLSLEKAETTHLTSGSDRDLFPVWSKDGKYIYFSRFGIDTDSDDSVTINDNAVIYSVNIQDDSPFPYPLTSASYSAFQPVPSGTKLFFLSTKKGISNVWTLPLDGEIPSKDNAEDQTDLAIELAETMPPDLHLAVLGYYKIMELFPGEEALWARAAYSIGRLYENSGMEPAAEKAYHMIGESHREDLPEAILARIHLAVISAHREWNNSLEDKQRRTIFQKALSDLRHIMAEYPDLVTVQGRGLIENARLMGELGGDAGSLLEAIRILDQILEDEQMERAYKAEAMLLRADLFSRTGQTEELFISYSRIIKEFPDQAEWVDRAVERILLLSLGNDSQVLEDQIQLLATVADRYREEMPRLSMGAWNRMGDIYYSGDQWVQAKEAYTQVLDNFPVITTQTAAARLSLAEILYQEGRFRQALDLYEKEMALRTYEDYLYGLVREAYVRKSIAAAEYQYRLSEIPAAANLFINLVRDDYSIVEAHRGYIKCAASRNTIPALLGYYRKQLLKEPANPITLYAIGLSMTYLEGKEALKEAQSLILRAIQGNGQVEYFHQTLGYIYEVLESVYGERGSFESALESYQKAFFLNDPENNPENRANLLLNMGNGYLLLGQYGKAFENYSGRFESGQPFDQEDTEIQFYRSFGIAAFHTGDPEQSILAFTRALDLIDRRIEPRRASEILGSVNTYLVDRIITPALKRPESSENAEALAEIQADLNRRLYEASSESVSPPPDPTWEQYSRSMDSLIEEEEGILGDMLALVDQNSDDVSQSLYSMTERARDALLFPQRMMHLKAEIFDRLGLAFQETENWYEAMEAFEQTYILNERLEMLENLAINQRSISYNAYMEAGTRSGPDKEQLLERALEGFHKVKDLIKSFGLATKEPERRKKALISLAFDVDLDETGSTSALYGFSSEQEERLAEAFISRIEIEMGNLVPSREILKEQLDRYPPEDPVSDKDLYGVSLLYHRAGHLDYALRDSSKAFDNFSRSARLSLQLGNPVSASINVRNMALALTRISGETSDKEQLLGQLSSLDRETVQLLNKSSAVLERLIIPSYHNAMGTLYLELSDDLPADSVTNAARNMRLMQDAVAHFSKGLAWMKKIEDPNDRSIAELQSALHLNMAELTLSLGEEPATLGHFEEALDISRQALLPDHEWRALTGLGRLKEALEVLGSVTILRAGCGPGEITKGFAVMVAELLDEGMEEDAFNMVERLSEIERVHRLAYLFNSEFSAEALSILRNIYPRLLVIRKLRGDISGAEAKDRDLLQRRLDQEKEILEREIAEEGGDLLPSEFLSESETVREQLMIILGMSVHMEELADSAVKGNPNTGAESLIMQYRALAESYNQGIKELKKEIGAGQAPGIMGILWAEPVEAIDVMENLPDKAACIRLFRMPVTRGEWIAFIITPEDIRTEKVTQGFVFDLPADWMRLLIYEDLSRVPMDIGGETVALSATHLVRSIENRKPFKKRILAIPSEYSPPEGFQAKPLSGELTEGAILDALPQTHTLLINGNIYNHRPMPTRPGQLPGQFMVMGLNQGRVLSLAKLSDRVLNTSLALLTKASLKDSYTLGHLFSLLGVPTLLLHLNSRDDSVFVNSFFNVYETLSVRESIIKAIEETGRAGEDLIQLGFWGMTTEEAHVFATQNFARYAQAGIGAYKNGQYLEALSHFENALDVASETEELKRYLPDLYRYARESSYVIGRLKESIGYGRALADILAQDKPDSEDHAEALLKLGLVQAHAEQYKESIPVLEEAVEIMENLELGPEQVAALSDLGVVLENATEFDRALTRFQSAASLSESLNKEDLLARQYMSIGRIYDLRMNMYAMAGQSYGKAYSIYDELGDMDGMAQSLLDMGRCYRLLGNFKEADEHYEKALDMVKEDKDLRLKSNIRIEQANNAWYQARYQESFEIQREVSELARQHNWILEQIMAFNTSGLTWWTLGDHERALREMEEALAVAEALRTRKDEVATTLNNIGLVYRDMGDYHKAIEALDRALSIDRDIGSRWAIAYDLRNKALTYLRMGQPEKSVPLLKEALVNARAIGNKINEAKILLGLGDAAMSLEDHDEARDSFEKALELARSMAMRETEWRALFGLGKILIKEGRRSEAGDFLNSAIEVVEGMRAEIKIDQLKDGFIDNKMDVYETLVSLLVDLEKNGEAFDIAERSRARNLIDLLGNQRLDLRGAIDQEMYDRERGLRAEIRDQEVLLAQSGKEAERTVYGNTLNRLNDDYRDLLLEIQLKNPELASLISVNPLTLSECRALLEPEVALLAFYVVPDEILCWLIRKESIELFRTPIGRESLNDTVFTYRRMIQNLEPFENRSKELYSWVLSKALSGLSSGMSGSAEGKSPIRTLGVIPHGTLHYLSFATLHDGENYVADRFSLFYLPSVSVLRYTLERRKLSEKTGVLAIGNPDLQDSSMDLPFAEREVSAIGWNFPDITVLTRERATESWLVDNIQDFGIIHLASHGQFDPINPLFSSVKLVRDVKEDGDLETSEVFGLNINADLVVLSACQSGLGKVTGGDDVIGMNRAFLYGGTHAILSTLWRVSDLSTAILVKQFYRRYSTGTKAESLRQAMLHVKNRYPHPGYWGAFVLVGDYY